MLQINKLRADHVIDFAAEELKKYLRMMMPQCGDIDMYVGERNFKYVFDTFNTASDKHASDYKNMKHFDLEEDGVSIEIHRIAEIIPGRRRNRLFQEWTVRHLDGPDLRRSQEGRHQAG